MVQHCAQCVVWHSSQPIACDIARNVAPCVPRSFRVHYHRCCQQGKAFDYCKEWLKSIYQQYSFFCSIIGVSNTRTSWEASVFRWSNTVWMRVLTILQTSVTNLTSHPYSLSLESTDIKEQFVNTKQERRETGWSSLRIVAAGKGGRALWRRYVQRGPRRIGNRS